MTNVKNWMQYWQLMVWVCFGLLGLVMVASGATYNFYLNNVEQGDNSNTSPTLTVNDGKSLDAQTSSGIKTGETSPVINAARENVPAISGSSTQQLDVSRHEYLFDQHRWKVFAGAFVGKSSANNLDEFGGATLSYGLPDAALSLGGFGGVSYGLTRAVYFSLEFGGRSKSKDEVYAAADVEFYPVRIGGNEIDEFQLGIFFGGITMTPVPGNVGSLEGGLRININPSPIWGLTLAGRANLGLIQSELALTYRI